MFGSVNKAGNKVTQEVGIAQDVFGLLKGYRVESHINGRLGVEVQDGSRRRRIADVLEHLAVEDALASSLRAAIDAATYSASAVEWAIER